MITDPTLRWVVTILFAFSAAECAYGVVAARHRPVGLVGNLLHLAMAVAMGVMAWPWGAQLPTLAPMLFFLAGAVWFAVVALVFADSAAGRGAAAYHTAMMLAMAWMYAVMNGTVLPGRGAGGSATGHAGHQSMPGMDMSGSDMAGVQSTGSPAWVPIVNWMWTLVFALATLFWVYRYFLARRTEPGGGAAAHLGTLCQAAMAAGMAIMFAVMLAP